jgi:hypothetical protein
MAATVGRGRIIPRTIVLTALGLWIALAAYTLLPTHLSRFSQRSCAHSPVFTGVDIAKDFFLLPVILFIVLGSLSPWVPVIVLLPVQLTIVAWVVCIVRRRKDIWPRGERYRPRFRAVW